MLFVKYIIKFLISLQLHTFCNILTPRVFFRQYKTGDTLHKTDQHACGMANSSFNTLGAAPFAYDTFPDVLHTMTMMYICLKAYSFLQRDTQSTLPLSCCQAFKLPLVVLQQKHQLITQPIRSRLHELKHIWHYHALTLLL